MRKVVWLSIIALLVSACGQTPVPVIVTSQVTQLATVEVTRPTTVEPATSSPTPPKITFSVGPDQAPVYPKSLTIIPDEHTTIMAPAPSSDAYPVFVANK